jgi:N-acylneuraminate cytidylyltransferase
MKVAIIPARGGSKRIPRKNIRDFRGKPVLAWSAEAAFASGCFDRVILSTDDEETAAVAGLHGVDAPFRRPEELANDHVGTLPVIAHAVAWLRAQGANPRLVCCIYAAAPLIRAEDLRLGLQRLEETGADYVVTCTTYPYPVQRALRVDPTGRIAMLYPEHVNTRSQDLVEAIHDAGQFYWGRAQAFAEGRPILGPGSEPLMIPRYRAQDIDTLEDWTRAEFLHRALTEGAP